MRIQAFVDDSGRKGSTKHFVLVGLVSSAEHWVQFSEEWLCCLKQHPPVHIFKMTEAASCTGQFFRVPEDQRNVKLRALANIINRHVQLVTYSVIDLTAHAETWAKFVVPPQRDPYFFAFHNTITSTILFLS